MKQTTKNVSGQLLDKNTKTVLAEANITITLIDTQLPNDHPYYELYLTVDGYRPELDNKTHLLKLNENLIGEVFISIPTDKFPGLQTHFKVNLQSSIWNNLDWFQIV